MKLTYTIVFIYLQISAIRAGSKGKVTLILDEEEFHLQTKICKSGAFFQTLKAFDCGCISGVWAFYSKVCGKPALMIGGDEYCFRADNLSVHQIAIVGNPRYPYTPSLTHFHDQFSLITKTYTEEEYKTDADAVGSWVTVSDTKWTLYGDSGETICLVATTSGKRIYCLFNQSTDEVVHSGNWNTIIKIKRGCYSKKWVMADNCFAINAPNDVSHCNQYPTLKPLPVQCDNENDDGNNPKCGWVNISPFLVTTPKNSGEGWIPLYPPLDSPKSTTPPLSQLNETPDLNGGRMYSSPTNTSSSNSNASARKGNEDSEVCEELNRESVKQHWLDPATNECAKSINEAIFTDQLRRFAVTRLDKIFDSRLHSIEQMEQLLFHSRDIIKKTCGVPYVPLEFFNVATDAFRMFIREDFLYGVEGVDPISYERILKSLTKCMKRAKPFVFEANPLSCDLKQITGTLILPGEKLNISVPENGKSKHFEPLIETVWKMFINTHSYCFEDFQFINDHHHFSVLFLEMFSRSIYEKWIEPLRNKQLYKFVVPKFQVMKEIMENLDYCVSATNHVSKCQVWLARSSPLAKSIVGGSKRKKRSIWTHRMLWNRNVTSIWKNTAFCTQTMEEPFVSLGYFHKCNQVF